MNKALYLFPVQRQQLLKLADEDQDEIRAYGLKLGRSGTKNKQEQLNEQLTKHCHKRARILQKLLDEIGTPTITSIGEDGVKAAVVVALHGNKDVMLTLLNLLDTACKNNPDNVPLSVVPPLRDRLSVLQNREQIFGTNWMMGHKDQKPFLIPVKDFATVNTRRDKYGLPPLRRPVNLAYGADKYPLGRGLARETDQRPMTEAEYQEYASYYLTNQ